MEIIFMCGLSLITAALDIYYRDMRYLVECSGLLMFWGVPIFYTVEMIPGHLQWLYLLNPIAAVAAIDRQVMFAATAPSLALLAQLCAVSVLALLLGFAVFRRLERNLADYL
jgi:ABC-type polysaccharide/polyol phosphate export permease